MSITHEVHERLMNYARLARRKSDLNAKLNQVEAQMAAKEQQAVADLGDCDDQQFKGYGMTLAISDSVAVSAENGTDGVVAALKRTKSTRGLIGVNWSALRVYVRENAGSLPKALATALQVKPTQKVHAARSRRPRK